ncbi:methionine aminotransferase [Hufsiella ginkgonis]|uniref:Aminotransferase class I/II-fold pyridoxal phosphate-dependent enzyme n=1 Tax=Hufsiella ginkgonis TaxID=2695274 RepID=A0A7K1Y064_9SPHI|nr:methionine aminotransferase [Hufsiella ginkgonis]MXV16610.1 aminotransferase class I/II-fold pyridoxal phosphate-dependent enzyme [Hufsiella ginkgonis]
MLKIQSRLPDVGTSIFSVMSKLAIDSGAINLSQGFPDFDCAPELIALVEKHLHSGKNQYAPMTGVPVLNERIAEKVNGLHGSNYRAESEVTVTAGGTQALFTAIAATIHPGDEVIIFEPAYDSYIPSIRLFGGVIRSVALTPPDYRIDWQHVRSLVTPRTRMILLNSPQNPSGTILTEEDMRQLTDITRDTNIVMLSDEVYEHLVYDGLQHQSMARFPELRERSFIVASFGKLFHTTGWKLGYCVAPAQLMSEFRKVHQFNVFSVNTPMQYAAADFLSDPQTYLQLSAFFQRKRDEFTRLMKETRFDLLPCKGSYFLSASYSRISGEPDTAFTQRLTKDFGVAAIPVSAFYAKGNDYGIVRFCFAKKQETLEKAVERLMNV